jgi:hypothetical protein
LEAIICDFLTNADIYGLFKSCISNPLKGKEYALIYSDDSPQFYFVDFPLDEGTAVNPKGNRVVLGLFSEKDFDNQNKIEALLLQYKCY